MKRNVFWIVVLGLTLTLQACGSGGGNDPVDDTREDTIETGVNGPAFTGVTSAATINASNAGEFAITGAFGAKQAVLADSAPLRPVQSVDSSYIDELRSEISESLDTYFSASERAEIVSRITDYSASMCPASGSAILDFPDSGSNPIQFSYVYEDCTRTNSSPYGTVSIVFNGTVTVTQTGSISSYERVYDFASLTITISGPDGTETRNFNSIKICRKTSDQNLEICRIASDFEGYDGRIYRISDTEITETGSNTYEFSARTYHPDYGYITITGNIIFGDCLSGQPSSGELVLTGGGQVATVVFNSCIDFTITYGDESHTYQWSNALVGDWNDSGDGSSQSAIDSLADISGVWSITISDDERFLFYIGESGIVNIYREEVDCYVAAPGDRTITHTSGNAFTSNFIPDFTATFNIEGSLVFTYAADFETLENSGLTIDQVNSALCE